MITRMVTEYEALGTLMGTILRLSKARELRAPDEARHEPVAQINCKTARLPDQIRWSRVHAPVTTNDTARRGEGAER